MPDTYSGSCATCHKMNTTGVHPDTNQFECSSCASNRYYKELHSGQRGELRIRWKDYKVGTKEEIALVLARNKIVPDA